jgi:hypothetical protein
MTGISVRQRGSVFCWVEVRGKLGLLHGELGIEFGLCGGVGSCCKYVAV